MSIVLWWFVLWLRFICGMARGGGAEAGEESSGLSCTLLAGQPQVFFCVYLCFCGVVVGHTAEVSKEPHDESCIPGEMQLSGGHRERN